jgi:hypothetical protein
MAEIEKLPIELLQRRLRALLIVGSLLGPAFCVFGVLVFLAEGWARWVGLCLWLGLGLLLSLWLARLLRTLAALNDEGQQ